MSTYVIGDIQGCFSELTLLLEEIQYESVRDHLWFVGDLINRGPENAKVLDLVMSLANVTCVLGNHDLHFLAIACGQQTQKRSDTLDDLLDSDKRQEYVEFLRHLPLLHWDRKDNLVMVHAGLPPQLSIETCIALAGEVEAKLRSTHYETFLAAMYGNEPDSWQEDLTGMDRLRIITNYFTRLRYCTADGRLELTHKAEIQPDGYSPWFSFGRSDQQRVLFGHWAALEGDIDSEFAVALDTGCVWGRKLTALRLDDGRFFSVNATG